MQVETQKEKWSQPSPGRVWDTQWWLLAGQRADTTVPRSLSSHASLCVLDWSTVLPGMLGPDPERSQSSFWWSNPHHFPPQEKEETLLPVSQLLFHYLKWLETHCHPTVGKNGSQSLWPSSSQKEGMTREEVADPEACPSTLWALPSTAHYQPTATSSSHPEASTLHTPWECWAQIAASATADHVGNKIKAILSFPSSPPRTWNW